MYFVAVRKAFAFCFPTRIFFANARQLNFLMATSTSAANGVLDASKALQVLEQYESRDGLSASDLMMSKIHGGLTYGDFLLLPGRIEFSASDVQTDTPITRRSVCSNRALAIAAYIT